MRVNRPGLLARQKFRVAAGTLYWILVLLFYTYQASFRPAWPGASMPEEDAFISFRFAEHIAEGRGPVFNEGQAPVEGYTNFLWVAWLAGLHDQWPDTVTHALVSGWILGFVCLVASFLLARRVSARWSWWVPWILACSAYFTDNVFTGMETMAYTLIYLTALGLFADVLREGCSRSKRHWATFGTSVALLLAALTRFEAVYLFGLFSLFWIWRRRKDEVGLGGDWRWYLPFGAGYGVYTIWRLKVFGAWLPATYWAKRVITRRSILNPGYQYLHRIDRGRALTLLQRISRTFGEGLPAGAYRID